MKRYMLLMHDDTIVPERLDDWRRYLGRLRDSGRLEGGSSIAAGSGYRKGDAPAPSADHLVGYLLLSAPSADDVLADLEGNPVYEAGGTIEIRELIAD